MGAPISRRGFLRSAAAAGLAGPLLVGCGDEDSPVESATSDAPAPTHPSEPTSPNSLGRDYLALGLMALSHAHKRGWARGHHGAAVIASYYFCQENDLDERTTRALRKQVDAFVHHRRAEFPPLDPGPGVSDPARIVDQLDDHIGELRSGGHDAIYSALALRALRDVPHFATPTVVDGICRLLEGFVATLPVQEPSDYVREHPLAAYRDAADLKTSTLQALRRPWRHMEQAGTGVVVHWLTHADALVTLEELGYGEVAWRGHAAHQRYMNRPVGPDDLDEPEAEAIDWVAPAYWESDAPRRPQKGSWFFGHSFKLPYSLFRLLRDTADEAVRTACLERAAKLHLPFT